MITRLLPLLPVFASGCAWDAGHGFSTIDSSAVGASFEPDGAVMSDLGYVVTPRQLNVEIESVALESSVGEGEAQTFERVVDLEVMRELDALAHESFATEPAPSAELPETELRRATVTVTGAHLLLTASEGDLGSETLDLDVDVPLPAEPSASLDFAVNRGAPERIRVGVELRYGANLFDALDFAALGSGDVTLSDPADPLLLQLSSNLAAAEVVVAITEEK